MTVEVQLDTSEKFIVYTIREPLNIDELMQAYVREKEIRDSLSHTLHSIVDMSGVNRIPPNWLTAKAGPGLTHPRSGNMLFVGLSRPLTRIITTITTITGYTRMRFFATRDQADVEMARLINSTGTQV